jgi:Domain of unknown function (DUF6894)
MPRFFFNFTDGNEKIEDPDGSDLPDLVAAQNQAVLAVRDVRRTKFELVRDWSSWSVQVLDEHGSHLFSLLFSQVD